VTSGTAQKPCKKPHGANCFEPTLAWDDASNAEEPWEYWKREYGKTYDSVETESYRRGVWEDNTRYIMKVNNEQNNTFSLGWSSHSDSTSEERNIRLKGHDGNATLGGVLGATHRGEFRHGGRLTDLPSSVDWTYADPQVVTEVKYQQCGDCWAFSATGCLEGALAVGNGWTMSLSAQQMVDCSGKGTCDGGNELGAMKWATDNYVCSWDSYPETGHDGKCQWGCDQVITAGSIWGTYRVTAYDEGSLCAALLQRPITVAISTGSTLDHYKGGILSGTYPKQVDHAVLAVGYDYDENGTPFWKIKNSWGKSWGIDGYLLLYRGGDANQNQVLSDPSGVYVYGPYNPSMQLTTSEGFVISAPKGPAPTAAIFQV